LKNILLISNKILSIRHDLYTSEIAKKRRNGESMKNEIKRFCYDFGADVCGIANIKRFSEAPKGFHPADILPTCKSVIVFGLALPKGLTKVDSRLIYGHFNNAVTGYVDTIAFQTAKKIEKEYGVISVPVPCDSPYDYWDADKLEGKGLLSMKHAAVLAGLGALGKNTLLLNPEYGNLLTVGVILTELDLESDELNENICLEECRLCIDNCPIHGLDGKSVNQMLCRLNTYKKTKRGFDTVECNECRTICPKKYGK
jgi:epoxyqueuosine reductase